MADTVINNPGPSNNGGEGSGAGWAVAVVVIIIVLIGAFLLFRHYSPGAAPSTNINVSLPTGGTSGTGATGQ